MFRNSISRKFFSSTTKLGYSRIVPDFNAGQPLYETRPYLVNPGELTPGITAVEYYQRRLRLASRMKPNSIAILVGHNVKYASGAVFYPFQQNTDFFYMTGWDEPNSVAIIERLDNGSANDFTENVLLHMIVPPKDTHAEKWDGFRTGVEGSVEIFNADYAESNKLVKEYIEKLLIKHDTVYIDLENNNDSISLKDKFGKFFNLKDNPMRDTIGTAVVNKTVKPLSKLVSDLRLVKSDAEIKIMRQAGKISGRAYNQAYAKRFDNERTLASFLEYKFVSGGCSGHAYVPVVGAGPNALSIHYVRNDDVIYNDELVLVDSAGQLGKYRADISRTWPAAGGKFTEPQRDLYQAVLNVNKKCIEMCTLADGKSLNDIHNASTKLLFEELKQLPGLADCLKNWDIYKLYPHYVGHNLGLDVHDVPECSRTAPLKPNQVITIEPGVYFPLDDFKYPIYYRGIGIRIEDNIAVGKNDYTVLTPEAAKEIVDIENIAQNGVTTNYKEDVVNILDDN